MTTFTIRPDDTGVQSLKRKNTRPSSATAVTQIAATTTVHTAQTAPADDQGGAFLPVHLERRKQQRRKHKDETEFDTRADEERRTHSGMSDEESADSEAHIDVDA